MSFSSVWDPLCKEKMSGFTRTTLHQEKNSSAMTFDPWSGSTSLGKKMILTSIANWTLRLLDLTSITLVVGRS